LFLERTGRVKEMFTVGGFNVSPPEIENFLLTHPSIENASVVGISDERPGEVGSAFIKSKRGHKLSKDEVIEFCQGRIADIKVPRYVFFVEELPLTRQGKVQKFKLREQAITEHLKRPTNR
jgi:fatty-acyl-CoA synthase